MAPVTPGQPSIHAIAIAPTVVLVPSGEWAGARREARGFARAAATEIPVRADASRRGRALPLAPH